MDEWTHFEVSNVISFLSFSEVDCTIDFSDWEMVDADVGYEGCETVAHKRDVLVERRKTLKHRWSDCDMRFLTVVLLPFFTPSPTCSDISMSIMLYVL
jgi:hypothetical protein